MSMRARQFRKQDFEDFDYIVVMDHSNLRDVRSWRGAVAEKIHLAMSFDKAAREQTVPDPYYGGLEGFTEVADMLEAACSGLLDEIIEKSAQTA